MSNQKVTYLLGAGASAHAIPVVKAFKVRFKIFIAHLNAYATSSAGVNARDLGKLADDQKVILKGIDNHFTVDTYAKKLFLQNPILPENSEYHVLINYLTCYFLYEQLDIDLERDCNRYLRTELDKELQLEPGDGYIAALKNLPVDLDYRYDSLFAGILINGKNNSIILPDEFAFISWNYDFQLEKSLMNFTNDSLDDTIKKLNVLGTKQKPNDKTVGNVIKLNGTAGFIKNERFAELFDFKSNVMDSTSFDIFLNILLSTRSEYANSLRFAWEKDSTNSMMLDNANALIKSSEYVVIIGYSFPYFNRDVDKQLFKGVAGGSIANPKIFIQSHIDDVNSIQQRFKAISGSGKSELHTELDQFLLPHGL